jgi:dienelactone hydrolase
VYDARAQAREDDLSAVVNYARRSGATSVVLVGGSLGASLSITMASELHVQGVVSLSARWFGSERVRRTGRACRPRGPPRR